MWSNFTTTQKSLLVAIAAVILYVLSTTLSYSAFAAISHKTNLLTMGGKANIPTPVSAQEEDPNAPKVAECPLNGEMHTQKAKDAWVNRRPLAVMIENSPDARPQSGVSNADIVYEAVAEGGITRFMAVFLCELPDTQVGPVRSARTYFLDWLGEYDALYAHVGGANTPGPADALGQIVTYKVKDLNQFNIGFPTFWRDYQRLPGVATEHTMYSTTYKLWDIGADRDWTATDSAGIRWDASFKPWKFKSDDSSKGSTTTITVPFWSGYNDFTVVWKYDVATNSYLRTHNNTPHIDNDNQKQLAVKNIVVQFETEAHANDGYDNNAHLLYGTKGTGKALFFMDGKVVTGTWNKASRTARTVYMDSNGKEISFDRGIIWVQTTPAGNTVTY